MSAWGGAGILFMPVLIGVVVGWVARRFANVGGPGLAGFAAVIILLAGLGGPERTILEASRVMKNALCLDAVAAACAKEPVTETDISNCFAGEQPCLKQLVAGETCFTRQNLSDGTPGFG